MSVKVTSGANSADLEVAGQTVRSVRDKYADDLAIAPTARPTVNGAPVDETFVLRDGQRLNFVKNTAEKGLSLIRRLFTR